ncbi:hypothetical protein [Rothia nasimurium]|uniref:hypothetical protein n=1 Tax=Rothia nasimurium TaxID=85336 RepID=UPI001F2F5B5A|nr:hypothetical protein [Rothia nasimurium]
MKKDSLDSSVKLKKNLSQQPPASNKTFGKFVSYFLVIFAVVVCGYYLINIKFDRPIDCTVVSATGSSGGGGLKTSSSSPSVTVTTQDCGNIVFVRMRNEGFDTAQDLADELNKKSGEKVRFHVGPIRLFSWPYEAKAADLDGHPIQK